VLPVVAAVGQDIRTIEGLDAQHPVKEAWIAEQVPQCGYCQSGQIMSAVALLEGNPSPTEADVRAGMVNICRCGTYPRIHKAVLRCARPVTP
jgi:aerobic-type carbon monoxide dehydrogenase small subunit (CoxS/CutS family)